MNLTLAVIMLVMVMVVTRRGDLDLTISCAQPESTMKSITQGTTASTFERTFQ